MRAMGRSNSLDASDDPGRDELLSFLESVTPFRFLKQSEKLALIPELERAEFCRGDTIIEQGEDHDHRVYLIYQGSVEVIDPRRETGRHQLTIEACHYFGEWEPLFEEPRVFSVRALQHTVCYVLSGRRLLELVGVSRAFAQALGNILRDRQGIFSAFDHFTVELIRSANRGYVPMVPMLRLYQELQPALHPLAAVSEAIDFAALEYAVRRLPDNVTRVFAFLLTDQLPGGFVPAHAYFPAVPTAARRRDIWEVLPGKNVVLLRDGISDLVDLTSCLCLYAVEARKIRLRVQQPGAVAALFSAVNAESDGRADGGWNAGNKASAVSGSQFAGDPLFPFSADEVLRFRRIWPDAPLARLWEIACHREMFAIRVRRRQNRYNSRRSELWTEQVGSAAKELFGLHPSGFPDDLPVHIISSNTHSVTNCLNPWYAANGSAILQWAAAVGHPTAAERWADRNDLIYALARDYFLTFPDRSAEAQEHAGHNGILRLKETASTGIQVQIIDTARIDLGRIDPGITLRTTTRRAVIVNIDYAFGEQAQHIIRNLLMLFGTRVRSINFLGKAGALVGRRGDVLVPTAFIEQSSDQFEPLPDRDPQAIERLQERLPGNQVYRGPLLTVNGTLLQNRTMLHFYRRIWGCVGLEMEGFHFYRQVIESSQLGVVSPQALMRFYYYVSDIPLDSAATLSAPLASAEGVPPLYAITRQILSELLD
ncbi:MAG: hypothetical protein EA384_13920 [Spirochaetaceae bacterium]|nr:MAG: hypothetical protein EA384_13920 [Spirochaetaceae bacterium]